MPSELMVFGEGGVAGISSLCGALIGAASAIFLVAGGLDGKKRGEAFEIIREFFTVRLARRLRGKACGRAAE
jgi:hypothetical protein